MKFRLLHLAFLGLLFCYSESSAQKKKQIQSDRPGFAYSAFTVGQGVVQAQAGGSYLYSNLNSSELDSAADNYVGELQIRVGLSHNTEIFGAIAYTKDRTVIDTDPIDKTGLTDLDLGVRINMFDNKGWVPSASLIAQLKMNKYDGDFGIDRFAPRILLSTTKSPTDFLNINTNIGIEWDGINLSPSSFYVLNLSINAGEKLGFFAENYGTLFEEDLDSGFNAGLFFTPSNNIQLDLGGGFARNNGLDQFLSSLGISWRLGA